MKQIKLNKWISGLIIVATLVAGVWYFTKPVRSVEIENINLSTTTLKRTSLEDKVAASGIVVSAQSVNVTNTINAVFTNVNVQVGDEVKKGDVLATVDTKALDQDIADARYTYNNAKTLYDNKVQAAWEKLDAEKRRYAGGYTEGTSEWQYVYDDAINWDAKVQAAQTEYDNARLNDTTTNAKAQLDTLLETKANATLRAPIDGIVTNVNAREGNVVTGIAFVVQNMDELNIDASIPGYDIIKLERGMKVEIQLNDVEASFKGTITKTSPITNALGDFDIQASIDDETDALRLGMEATIRIQIAQAENVFVVPLDAVVVEADKTYVVAYDAMEETALQKREIEVTMGMETDYYVAIEGEDLVEGLSILNDPLNKLKITETVEVQSGPFRGN